MNLPPNVRVTRPNPPTRNSHQNSKNASTGEEYLLTVSAQQPGGSQCGLGSFTHIGFAAGEFPFAREARIGAALSDEAFAALNDRRAEGGCRAAGPTLGMIFCVIRLYRC